MIRWLDDTLRELVNEYPYAAVFLACLVALDIAGVTGVLHRALEHFR